MNETNSTKFKNGMNELGQSKNGTEGRCMKLHARIALVYSLVAEQSMASEDYGAGVCPSYVGKSREETGLKFTCILSISEVMPFPDRYYARKIWIKPNSRVLGKRY